MRQISRRACTAAVCLGLCVGASAHAAPARAAPAPAHAAPAIDRALAERYFQEAEAIGRKDAGKLWGRALNGPLLFADPATHEVVANQADAEHRLTPAGRVFVGTLPAASNVANTAFTWAGVHWTMLAWPLPEKADERAILLAHELWHRIQDDLGFPPNDPDNAHLDALEGRILLQLEWRALARALGAKGEARRAAVADALVFRQQRRAWFPGAEAEERALEMNEGLAEYTGIVLGASFDPRAVKDAAAMTIEDLDRFAAAGAFLRTFAYASGPAYGVLLDGTAKPWRPGLRPQDDLGALLGRLLGIALPPHLAEESAARAASYDGAVLRAAETERDRAQARRIADYRARLVTGPTLTLPLARAELAFDPTVMVPLEHLGTVYPAMRAAAAWGVLSAKEGVLVREDGSEAVVAAPVRPTGRRLAGPGWTLTLEPGWRIVKGPRQGDFVLAPPAR